MFRVYSAPRRIDSHYFKLWPQLFQEDPLQKGLATHSNILTWRIPWMRSLVGYSPCGHKELDTTERLTLSHFQKAVILLGQPDSFRVYGRWWNSGSIGSKWSPLPCLFWCKVNRLWCNIMLSPVVRSLACYVWTLE